MKPFSSLRALIVKFAVWGPRALLPYVRKKIRVAGMRRILERNLRAHAATVPRGDGVTLVGPFRYAWSISKVMRDFARRLEECGIPFQTFDTGGAGATVDPSDYAGLITPAGAFDFRRYGCVVEAFGAGVVAKSMADRFSRLVFWESEHGLLQSYPELADGAGVAAMSDFNAGVFRAELPAETPVRKILYPLRRPPDGLPVRDAARDMFGLGRGGFIVFSNFDISSYERKNPEGMLRAFAKAFAGESSAHLLFKINCADEHPARMKRLRELAEELGVADRLTFFVKYLSQRDLYALAAACDAYLSLNRGEGFGLGIAEAMQLGKPVVVTAFGAPLEFCNASCAELVPCAMRRPAFGETFAGVDSVPEPDVDAAAAALHRLFADPERRADIGRKGSAFVEEHFSDENFRRSVEAFLVSGV